MRNGGISSKSAFLQKNNLKTQMRDYYGIVGMMNSMLCDQQRIRIPQVLNYPEMGENGAMQLTY